MSDASADALLFADVLSCEDEFPLALRTARDAGEAAVAARRGEAMLRSASAIEESSSPDDGDAGPGHARLEAKVDLALALLAAIAAERHPLPPARPVRWSLRGLRVHDAADWPPGTRLIASAYLLPSAPLPVELPLEVAASRPDEHGHTLWLRFAGLSDGLAAGIERELFRRHRRLVAGHRARR